MILSARLRTVGWTVHRWIGLGLALLLVPMGTSGALLVWRDQLDALLHPARYAVTGVTIVSPSAYFSSAAEALASGTYPTAVRFPDSEGWPVVVIARGAGTGEGSPPRLVNVYLDPPTARVLDVVDFRSSLFGWLHRFHENLTIPKYSGRTIVGWVGIGMLILSLTGIWLWWPRSGVFLPGLRWSRTTYSTTNLHHLLGFWLSMPLAVVSATGVYLGFPQTARQLTSAIVETKPQRERAGSGTIAAAAMLTPELALAAALKSEPTARPVAVYLPMVSTRAAGGANAGPGKHAREAGSDAGARWRVQMRRANTSDTSTVVVNDRSGRAELLPDPLPGDRLAEWVRWIHEGSHLGLVWQFLVFATGLLPPVFVVTGIIMWRRGRSSRRRVTSRPGRAAELQTAR
jgi:uncharacterized iron-regulated membrane protein